MEENFDPLIEITSKKITVFSFSVKLLISRLPPEETYELPIFGPDGNMLSSLRTKSDNEGYLAVPDGDRIISQGTISSQPIPKGSYKIGIIRGVLERTQNFDNWEMIPNEKKYISFLVDYEKLTNLGLEVEASGHGTVARGKLWFKGVDMPWSNGSTDLRGKIITIYGNDIDEVVTYTDEFSSFSTKLNTSKLQSKCWIQARFEGDELFDKCESEVVYYYPPNENETNYSEKGRPKGDEESNQRTEEKDLKKVAEVPENSDSLITGRIPVLNDYPTAIDSLGRRSIAFVIANRLNDIWKQGKLERVKSTFLINVDGPWGSGKTSLLKMIRNELQIYNNMDWIVIEFNAWQHQRIFPPWWSLIMDFYNQCEAQIRALSFKRSIRFRITELFWRLSNSRSKVFLISALSLFALGLLLLGLPNIGIIGTPVSLVLSLISIYFGVKTSLFPGSEKAAQDFIRLSQDPLQSIRTHFSQLMKVVEEPVVILVDDLDRCKEDYVVEFIEGIQTLFKETDIMFIVAADKRWIYSSYEKEYSNFASSLYEPGRPLGSLFLEKIFQISFTIPRMTSQYKTKYLRELLKLEEKSGIDEKSLRDRAQKEVEEIKPENLLSELRKERDPIYDAFFRESSIKKLEEPESIAETRHWLESFSHLLEPNPRAMKRLIITFMITRALFILRVVNIDYKILALWIILNLRWPELGSYLEKDPTRISEIGKQVKELSDGIPVALRPLFSNRDVIDIVKGKDIGMELNETNIKSIIET